MVGFQVTADQNPSTDTVPRLIPYNGTLEFNGEPVTKTGEEAPWLKFEVIDNSALGEGGAQTVYTQTMQTNIFAGRFTAMLGPSDDFGVNVHDVVKGGDDLLLQMTVLGNHDPDNPESTADDDVTLSNPQRLVMSPFAMWATNATNFNVANNLQANSATVTGTLQANAVNVSSQLDVETINVRDITLTHGDIADNNGPVVIDDTLHIKGNITLNDVSLSDSVEDYVWINDGLWVQDKLTLDNGPIVDRDGPVVIDDGLWVQDTLTLDDGSIVDNNGPVVINDTLHIKGNITLDDVSLSDSVEDYVWINDGLWVQDKLTLDNGPIVDTNGPVVIDDNTQVNYRLTTKNISISGSTSITAAHDRVGQVGYGTGFNDTWATCGSSGSYKPIVGVRLRRSAHSDQMLIEARCAD